MNYNKITVVGLGPGHPDYITPGVRKFIEEADLIIGGKRNLQSISTEGKETFIIKNNLKEVLSLIKENYENKKICLIVSGDPGFYSILSYVKKHFRKEEIFIIPGISSLQYMFSRLSISWEEAYLGSLHGRNSDFIDKVKHYKTVGLLTDNEWTPEKIAKTLYDENITDRRIFIGENLSYEDEKITEGTVEEIAETGNYKMCVVVITDESLAI